jgi:hypothetical protein
VREMLCNAAYAGYVSGRRDKSKAIKGVHESIVEEALFDRVQQMRHQRARTLKPGVPPRGICCAAWRTAGAATHACTAPPEAGS